MNKRKRKPPVLHQVRSHIRKGRRVSSYTRGKGQLYKNIHRRKITKRTTSHPFLAQYSQKQQRILLEAEGYITEKYEITKPKHFWAYIETMEQIPDEVWTTDAGEIARIVMENRRYDRYLQKWLQPKMKGNPNNKRRLPRRWRVSPERQREMLTIRERAKIEKELGRRG